MTKFLLGVSLSANVVLVGAIVALHTTEGANIAVLYLKSRGYLAERT